LQAAKPNAHTTARNKRVEFLQFIGPPESLDRAESLVRTEHRAITLRTQAAIR